MDHSETIEKVSQAIRRIRSAMPRNREVMDICDFAEKILGNPKEVQVRLDDAEKRRRNVMRVQAWRAKRKDRKAVSSEPVFLNSEERIAKLREQVAERLSSYKIPTKADDDPNPFE